MIANPSAGTPGAALDALTAQLDPEQAGSLVIVFDPRPDEFFTAAQQSRLQHLLGRRQAAQDGGPALSPADLAELSDLVNAELTGSARRSAAIAREFGL